MTSSQLGKPLVRHEQVASSPLDPRSYRAITLPNELSVLIVSDKTSDKAAASMDVAVGSFSDPENLPGLAHFLEHMLFLGTSKYPEEGSYNSFLAENGGYSNAYTAAENTNYHFQIVVSEKSSSSSDGQSEEMPKFKEALDRFAQFFTSPLFTESATERELNAVDSEHQKNLQSDSRRMHQLKKAAANKAHPCSRFGTGSKETLYDIPMKNNIDTRAALLKFHETYYSANLMKLCISGPHDLDTMEEWVQNLFSKISNSNRHDPSDEYREIQPLLEEHRGLIFHMETIKDIRQVELYWLTPPYIDEYESKPMQYVAGLLGDEGEGSLLSLLKNNGWCDGLGAGFTDQMTYSVLHVTATMTMDGVGHIDDIISLIYQYISMISESGVQEWLFKEKQVLAENSFRFLEKYEPFSFVTHTSSSMHTYPPEEYLSGPHLFKKYAPDTIRELLTYLTPRNGNIVVAGQFVSDKVLEKERWYQTSYHVETVESVKLGNWSHASVNSDLHIPDVNPFVPSDFRLIAEQLPEGSSDEEGPQLVLQNEYMNVHHKLDRSFSRPKATVLMQLGSPLAYQSPFNAVMANLLTCLLEDALTEYAYPAEKAGFGYRLYQDTSGIRLLLRGYSHRIDVLLEAIVKKISTFEADPVRFEMQKDGVERSYANFEKSQPYTLAMYNSAHLVEEPRWHVKDYLRRLRDGSVTVEAINSYAKSFRERLFVTSLVTGNIDEKSAVAMMESVLSIIGFSALPEAERSIRRAVEIPIGIDVYSREQHTNVDDSNSAIEVFYQTGPMLEFAHDAKLDLVGEILNKPAFHELRTVQQLGYIVFEGVSQKQSKRGIFFIIQSTVADPDTLLERINEFLADFRANVLGTMTEEKLKQYVSSLVANKAEPDTNLFERSWRFWKEIENEYLQFDRRQREIEELERVTKQDVIDFFDTYIAVGGEKRRRVISQVYGNKHPLADRRALREAAIEVSNPVAFRKQNPLYPVPGKYYSHKEENGSMTVA